MPIGEIFWACHAGVRPRGQPQNMLEGLPAGIVIPLEELVNVAGLLPQDNYIMRTKRELSVPRFSYFQRSLEVIKNRPIKNMHFGTLADKQEHF